MNAEWLSLAIACVSICISVLFTIVGKNKEIIGITIIIIFSFLAVFFLCKSISSDNNIEKISLAVNKIGKKNHLVQITPSSDNNLESISLEINKIKKNYLVQIKVPKPAVTYKVKLIIEYKIFINAIEKGIIKDEKMRTIFISSTLIFAIFQLILSLGFMYGHNKVVKLLLLKIDLILLLLLGMFFIIISLYAVKDVIKIYLPIRYGKDMFNQYGSIFINQYIVHYPN